MLTKPLSASASVRSLAAILWPALSAADSDFQRRKKLAIRSGHLAMVMMVVVAVLGTMAMGFPKLSASHLIGLAVSGAAYIIWSLYGTRDAVRFVLWHHGSPPLSLPPGTRLQSALYFILQFGLAELMVWLAGPARVPGLLWLVLLPPVGHSVMLLGRLGIGMVAVLSIAIHAANTVWWYQPDLLPQAMVLFLVAVLFTLVFTQIAVSAEQARGEVERLAGQLSEANQKLREYALQAEELAVTRERNRLAREIHDSVGHYLTVVHVQLEAARSTLAADPALALEALDKAQSMTHTGLREIRRSVAALRASPLDNRSLTEALRQVAAENQAAGLTTDVQVLGEARALSPQAGLTLYRAGQEGLTNCRKHSRATCAQLLADFREKGTVRLTVSDAGAGAAQTTGGFGLLGLRERAQLLGGRVSITTAPGQGFVLVVEVPG